MIMLDLNKDEGFSLDLEKELPGVSKLRVVMNWDPHPNHVGEFDLDIFSFALSNGKLKEVPKDVIYFKTPTNPETGYKEFTNGSIQMSQDNTNGSGDDDEHCIYHLDLFPTTHDRIAIYAFIHQAEQRKQHFGMIMNARIELFDETSGEQKAQFNMTSTFSGSTAVHAFDFVRGSDGKWSIETQGAGGTMDPDGVLKHYLP